MSGPEVLIPISFFVMVGLVFISRSEIGKAIAHAIRERKLRDLSPLWEMYQDGIDISTIQWTAH